MRSNPQFDRRKCHFVNAIVFPAFEAFACSLATFGAVRALEGRQSPLQIYCLLAAGLLVRLDYLVIAAVIAAFVVGQDRDNRRRNIVQASDPVIARRKANRIAA